MRVIREKRGETEFGTRDLGEDDEDERARRDEGQWEVITEEIGADEEDNRGAAVAEQANARRENSEENRSESIFFVRRLTDQDNRG